MKKKLLQVGALVLTFMMFFSFWPSNVSAKAKQVRALHCKDDPQNPYDGYWESDYTIKDIPKLSSSNIVYMNSSSTYNYVKYVPKKAGTYKVTLKDLKFKYYDDCFIEPLFLINTFNHDIHIKELNKNNCALSLYTKAELNRLVAEGRKDKASIIDYHKGLDEYFGSKSVTIKLKKDDVLYIRTRYGGFPKSYDEANVTINIKKIK